MLERIKGIQNPLTIIALFAGLAEVAGTVTMATVNKELQQTFIWFVMCFPTLLVVLFFATLIFKSRVLYAPSDFRSDERFLELQGLHVGVPAKRALTSRSAYERLRAAVIGGDSRRISGAGRVLREILIDAGYQPDHDASPIDLLGLYQKALQEAGPDVDPSGDKLKALNAAVAKIDFDQYGDR